MRSAPYKRGFTLIEVLVAIMLLGLAIASLVATNISLTKANGAGADLSTSEFLIETQAELKKVAWPPKAEVKGSAAVVVGTVIILGVFLYVVDNLLAIFTNIIQVYPSPS